MNIRTLSAGFTIIALFFCTSVSMAATSAVRKTQSAVSNGVTVRQKVAATGLYSQECYNLYYGCMDQFCISDNASGGSCACSDENGALEKKLLDIKTQTDNADNISSIEVEKIRAGARADIIFNGERKYDELGNIIKVSDAAIKDPVKSVKSRDLMAIFKDATFENNFETDTGISDKTGAALYADANTMCISKIPENCTKDLAILQQIYSAQIKSDCRGFTNVVNEKQVAANIALSAAQSDVRVALKDSFDEANKYDRGTCMIEFKKCMQTDDACGVDWTKCVSTIASENMQNNKAISTAGSRVKTINTFDITTSTMEILNSKRNICEKVLNQCVVVRNMVWTDFLREAAPTIKVAELNAESKMRQSCLTDISKCIQTACKDDIVGKGTDTMDSCLSRPDMARSFCKVQIDSCERMEPLIWGYVKDKLAAMRVDACTAEVKECFTSEDRCGSDFSKCIGMDYEYIHAICPLDKLVVCKKNNPDFKMADLDSMLMGLYLNIDNSALDVCQNKIDAKMAAVCGSATDCNKFAADDTIGTGSLRSQKDGTTYRVTGMISFGSIKMGDASGKTVDTINGKSVILRPGEIGVADYLMNIAEKNASVANKDAIMSSVEEELNNIAGTINRTIDMIAQDAEIQYCISGRDLTQITGATGTKTTARFPNMMNQIKMQIAISALRAANDNYNKKFTAEVAKATKDASADLAQYMCQKMAENGGAGMSATSNANTPLTAPYAISYDVGAGLSTEELSRGGAGVISAGGIKLNSGDGSNNASGMVKETTAIFSRDTRNCHICSTITTQSCNTKKTGGFFGIGKKNNTSCETKTSEQKCEDIVM